MRKEIICTIITADYGHYALALHDSVKKFNPEMNFAVFVTKGYFSKKIRDQIEKRENLYVYNFKDLATTPFAKDLKDKYYFEHHDAFRWGMKPVFINFLLQEDFKRIIYVDCDIYFFEDYGFLFEKLKTCKILLTPHWRSTNPEFELSNFKRNFLDGIYNAGFIGASENGEEALHFWAKLCLYKCEINSKEGFHDDQRYLDLLPTCFEGIDHVRHKGCNVANWNKIECKRTKNEVGKVEINNTYPIIFIHFTKTMFTGIFYENDKLLLPYLKLYKDNLLKYSDVDIIKYYFEVSQFQKYRNEKNYKKNSSSLKKKGISKLKSIIRKIKNV